MNLPPAAARQPAVYALDQPARRAITLHLAKRASLALHGLLLLLSTAILPGAENAASTQLKTTPVGWRGDGSAIYPQAGFPTEWDDTRNMRWRVKVGSAFSSPVIAADSVLVTSEPANIVCLNSRDGLVRWKASLTAADAPAEFKERAAAHERDASSCGYAAPTPVCDGHDAYFVFGTGLIACYSLDGNRKWVQYLEPAAAPYGHSSSPLLIGRKLIVNLHHLTALDADSGKLIWECAEAGHTYGTPVVMTLGEMPIVVTPVGIVVRASDGHVLARKIAPDVGGSEFGISPAASGDVVCLGDRTLTAVKLSADGDSVRVQKLWSAFTDVSAYATPVMWNGLLFFVGKTAESFVFDMKTGAKLSEQELPIGHAGVDDPDLANANLYPSLVIAHDKLLISNDRGQTFIYEASKEMKEISRNRLADGSGATPVLVGSSIILRSGNFLCCVGK